MLIFYNVFAFVYVHPQPVLGNTLHDSVYMLHVYYCIVFACILDLVCG